MKRKRILLTLAVGSLLLAGCSSAKPESSATACGTSLAELTAAAKQEGSVNLMALPDTWANYKGVLDTFRARYGIKAPVTNPDASSADELTAIATLRGQSGMPEVVDVGPSFTSELIKKGWAEAYKTTNWNQIPDALKDPDGRWIGTYSGIMTIASNTTLVKNPPKSWADLKKPEYKGQVTLNGDPRETGAGFAAVIAASLANGGSYDDIMPGIMFFSELKMLGNLKTVDITPAVVISGEAPIAIDWSYNFPGLIPQLATAGFKMQVNTPTDGVYASFYALAVVTKSAHPCAARLFLEHLASDEGSLEYMKGGAIPARLGAMLDAGVVPADLAATMPTKAQFEAIKFPTQAQTDVAKKLLTDNWGPMVASK